MPAAVRSTPPTIRFVAATPIIEEEESRPNSVSSKSAPPCAKHQKRNTKGDIHDHYGLRWLFDEDNPTHLPIDEKVLQYKCRDLYKGKLYKVATNVFWTPPSRKRVIVVRSDYMNRNSNARPLSPESRKQRAGIHSAPAAPVMVESSKEKKESDPLEYRSWIAERKALRANLDNMGLNEAYLRNKPNKTPLERSVLGKMIEERTPKPIPPKIPEEPPYDLKLPEDIPKFCRPCPEAIIVIEEHLSRNKMRLVDLFKNVDKKKKWVVTREEFTDAVMKAGIPLSEMALEDLIVSLDIDMDNCIDYRELVKGMRDWKLQKKRDKQRLIDEQGAEAVVSANAATAAAQIQHSGTPPKHSSVSTPPSSSHANSSQTTPPSPPTRPRAPILDARGRGEDGDVVDDVTVDGVTSVDPNRLTPPPVDTSPDRMDLESEENMVSLRKRNRETIRAQHPKKKTALPKTDFYDGRSMIKIGSPSIDNNCRPSTLVGEVGVLVDKFRQERLREYQAAVRVCEEYDVPLSQKLLAKVLLYPPEKPQSLLRRKLRQPGGALISLEQIRAHKNHGTELFGRGNQGRLAGIGGRGPGLGVRGGGGSGQRGGGGYSGGGARSSGGGSPRGRSGYQGGRLSDENTTTGADDDDDDDENWKGRYRPRKNKPRKMYLSTGKAYISRKVDCWMTFEEYEKFMSKNDDAIYAVGPCDDSAFWPGQLLDKLRLCMPPYSSSHRRPPGVTSVFQDVTRTAKRSNPGYNNDLNLWPQNGKYLVQGHYDPYKNKY